MNGTHEEHELAAMPVDAPHTHIRQCSAMHCSRPNQVEAGHEAQERVACSVLGAQSPELRAQSSEPNGESSERKARLH